MENREKILNGIIPELPVKSIFEIAGIDKEEKVITKMYQFFLRNDESHGLGTIFLDSLIEVAKSKKVKIQENWGSYQVKKEVATKNKNRIDLLIEELSGKEKKVIIIENKVNASLNNDLEDYWNHFKKYDSDKKFAFLIHDKPIEGNCDPFIKITHAEWLKKVRTKINNANLRGFFAIVALELANLFDKIPEDQKKIRDADRFATKNYIKIQSLKNSEQSNEEISPLKAEKINKLIEIQESFTDRLFEGLKNSCYELGLHKSTCRRNIENELTLKFAIEEYYFRIVFSIPGEDSNALSVYADFIISKNSDRGKFYKFEKVINNLKKDQILKIKGKSKESLSDYSHIEITQKHYNEKEFTLYGETEEKLMNIIKKDWIPVIKFLSKNITKFHLE